jgi:hypothetical protein
LVLSLVGLAVTLAVHLGTTFLPRTNGTIGMLTRRSGLCRVPLSRPPECCARLRAPRQVS